MSIHFFQRTISYPLLTLFIHYKPLWLSITSTVFEQKHYGNDEPHPVMTLVRWRTHWIPRELAREEPPGLVRVGSPGLADGPHLGCHVGLAALSGQQPLVPWRVGSFGRHNLLGQIRWRQPLSSYVEIWSSSTTPATIIVEDDNWIVDPLLPEPFATWALGQWVDFSLNCFLAGALKHLLEFFPGTRKDG